MPDRRVLIEEQMTKPFYDQQIVPGFPDPQSRERIARMFQKGHIIMRGDPAWGSDDDATAAERDTFFYTNAAPQVGFFEVRAAGSIAPEARESCAGARSRHISYATRLRCGSGSRSLPARFADDDPGYRFDSQVPMRFWKIAVWAEQGELRSIALSADQKPVLKVMPEGISVGAEAFFGDQLELARVTEFLQP